MMAGAGGQATGPRSVYLTFDDGPLPGTAEVLTITRRMEIPVSMMMVGKQVANGPREGALFEMAKRDPYTFVGNHSYSHASDHYARFYSNPVAVAADIRENQECLNLGNRIVRLPGRNIWLVCGRLKYDLYSGVEAARILSAEGYTMVGWDVEWEHDGVTGRPIQSVEEMIRDIDEAFEHAFTPGHVVVLAHDEMFRNVTEDAALLILLKSLKRKGYMFGTLEKYPACPRADSAAQ
jgi:peptidoglycan/xylan/chitin deacetylase (PgdA/CDA1 family)